MVTTGMMVERRLPRNRKITTITISPASISVVCTSLMDASMNLVAS